ncbi:lamin tail domain-containing protein [Patescibacteria group bacterium]|nr:lamin tail domain-containing protein [Patescibacteria group bacterium]MBU1703605.1 lamin tail domain-containing protein [Patescibacteria group bacterium]MBU1953564.1 lamin tail domain-containing protein [Patescibacteria group bacterium]
MQKTIIIVLLLFCSIAKAQTLFEQEATPAVISEPDAKIIIMEVNFKNSEADWIKMLYQSPSGKPINLKNLSFADDKIFKTIESDFVIASGQEILLTFKSDKQDVMPYLYTSQSGLTGTTEQFIIYDLNGQVQDAVCWTSDKPTASEISDQTELYEQEGWNSGDIASCIKSEQIKTNESIERIGSIDTNSAADWQIPSANAQTPVTATTAPSTPDNQTTEELEAPAIQALQEITVPAEQITADANQTEEILETPEIIAINKPATSSVAAKTSGSSSKKTSYQSGDLSSEIIISEILPNPDGDDSKKEWIELNNRGEEDVNLGNWQLDDSEDGSKPYTIPDSVTIKSGESLIITSGDSKLSLGNKEDSVRLFNYQEELIDQITYEEAPSGQSYSLITINRENGDSEDEWIWTADPTPAMGNPVFLEFTGLITKEPEFKEKYSFEVEDKDKIAKTIVFDEAFIAGPLAKATFTSGSTILITVEEQEDNTFELKKFEILAKGVEGSDLPPFLFPSLIGAIILSGIVTFFFLQKKLPWREAPVKSHIKPIKVEGIPSLMRETKAPRPVHGSSLYQDQIRGHRSNL